MKKIFLVLMALVLSNMALAHGEDKLGPNKGYVRMPGAFHTEVVPMGKSQIRVYLLDIDWKNPSVVKSEVKASVISKETEDVTCTVQENYFLCQFSKAISLSKKAELQITATREGQVGAVAKYKLPLKLNKDSGMTPKQQEKMDHSSHH